MSQCSDMGCWHCRLWLTLQCHNAGFTSYLVLLSFFFFLARQICLISMSNCINVCLKQFSSTEKDVRQFFPTKSQCQRYILSQLLLKRQTHSENNIDQEQKQIFFHYIPTLHLPYTGLMYNQQQEGLTIQKAFPYRCCQNPEWGPDRLLLLTALKRERPPGDCNVNTLGGS